MESLKQLFKDLPVLWKGDRETRVSAITANSKVVRPGALFVAKKGGNRYAAEAVASGAAAVVSDTYNPFLKVPQVIYPDIDALESVLGNRFYQFPADKLKLFGVTGTSGKTTTTYLIKHLLEPCGLVGTVAWMTQKRILPSSYTTPDLLTLLELFHEMVQEECSRVVLEVSSHGIEQGRVKDLHFEAALFTNLSPEHLDYHPTMEAYAAVKARLFDHCDIGIINGDDFYAPTMQKQCKAPVVMYGLQPTNDLVASEIALSSQGVEFILNWKGEGVVFRSPLIGRFNVYNLMAATAVALSQGMKLREISEKLASFNGVPGRLERVPNERNLQIFVDYAHKPEALKNVLETLNEFKKGKVITIFGCGGNRDTVKRPVMAAIAEQYSDEVIVTNDNPRKEDPQEIARQIIQGFQGKRYSVELDRKKAIEKAVAMATPNDIILIAGKGHENYQIFADRTIAFDDREIIRFLK